MARTSKGRVLFAGGQPTSALTRADVDRLKQTIGKSYPRITAALNAVIAELPEDRVSDCLGENRPIGLTPESNTHGQTESALEARGRVSSGEVQPVLSPQATTKAPRKPTGTRQSDSQPSAKRPIGRPKKEVDKYAAKWLDPRDVPLWKPDVYLRWCLDTNAMRDPVQYAAMTALWFEGGDVQACARVTGRSVTYLAELLRIAKAEVRAAARQMDWQEGWAATRIEPGPHSVGRIQLADSRVWFPPPCDWMAFAFEMERRVGL